MEENQVPVAPEAADITDDDKLWSLLSWIIWVIGLIALLMEDKKSDPFMKYNAIVSIILGALTIVLSALCIGPLFWIYGIWVGIKSYKGEWVEVPVITDFVKNQGWASTP